MERMGSMLGPNLGNNFSPNISLVHPEICPLKASKHDHFPFKTMIKTFLVGGLNPSEKYESQLGL